MEAAGLTAQDFAGEAVTPWPDNQMAFSLFQFMRTQWRIGMAGPTGLDYVVLFSKMNRMGLSPDEFDQLEYDIQVMEVAALNFIFAKT